MPLTDSAIRTLKPRERAYKISDERGLYLQVTPAGGRLWRMKFRAAGGVEKKLSFGSYPEISLKDARDLRDKARSMVANGVDPADKKRRDKRAAKVGAGNTFSAVATDYIAKNRRDGLADATVTKREWFLGLVERRLIGALKDPTHRGDRDHVDIIIALGMAKEGFDWIWCEHALTVGYRSSLTEIIQIIGRATRDAPGKTSTRFTNLIAEPDASQDLVVDALNDTLKAIAASLLMEQVLAPRFDFTPKNAGPKAGFDYGPGGYQEDGKNVGFNEATGQVHLEIKGLAGGSAVSEDAVEFADDASLLADLGVTPADGDISVLKHVRSREEVRAAEEIANRTRCEDFAAFKPLFEAVQQDLRAGVREARRFGENATIKSGEFFILGGQIAYVAAVPDELSTEHGHAQGRLRVIYANGTESDPLLRSMQRALYKDEAGRRITDPSVGPLFGHEAEGEDLGSGTIYVLRSQSDDPYVAEHRQLIHKIGVTGGAVETRIAHAALEATYLLAEVEIVATYKLFNINRTRLIGL